MNKILAIGFGIYALNSVTLTNAQETIISILVGVLIISLILGGPDDTRQTRNIRR